MCDTYAQKYTDRGLVIQGQPINYNRGTARSDSSIENGAIIVAQRDATQTQDSWALKIRAIEQVPATWEQNGIAEIIAIET